MEIHLLLALLSTLIFGILEKLWQAEKIETAKSCYTNTEKNNHFLKKENGVVEEMGSFIFYYFKGERSELMQHSY